MAMPFEPEHLRAALRVRAPVFAIAACLGMAACTFVTVHQPDKPDPSRPQVVDVQEPAAESTGAKKDALPPLDSCPSDLSIDPGPRNIDTREAWISTRKTPAKGDDEIPPKAFYRDKT